MHFGYFDAGARDHGASLLRMNEIVAGYGGVTAADRVLDAGCGLGGSAIWLGQHIGCSVVGVNIVPWQVRRASKAARARGFARLVRFRCEDYARTSFTCGTFDVFWALESLVQAASKEEVLREAYRVLKRGGRVVIADFMLRERPPVSSGQRQLLAPWLSGWAMPALWTAARYQACMQELGFSAIAVHDITENVRPSGERLGRLATWVWPTATMLHRIAASLRMPALFSDERQNNIAGCLAQHQTLRLGLWRYMVITGTKA